jgi:hypothetical protein
MMASNRCWRLARSLNTLAPRLPFEDVQMIITQLLQCSTNTLTVRH